jgi:hypothetical protein
VLRDSHKKAQDHLYVALKSAQHEAECKHVLDIVNGFEEAGTAATNEPRGRWRSYQEGLGPHLWRLRAAMAAMGDGVFLFFTPIG